VPSLVAFVPARAGSERVPGKNVRPLAGHPLLAYAVVAARQAGADRVVCSTDSEEIAQVARRYGADVPFLRPAEYATSASPDIDWLCDALRRLDGSYDLFALVRPTSPFRGPDAIRRGLEQLLGLPEVDSIRAVEPVKQHPGKMWLVDGQTMRPLLDQSELEVPWHDSQFQTLPPVYVQSSALEIAWSRVLGEGSRGGGRRAPFLTRGYEGFTIDYEEDWARAEALVETGAAVLPSIDVEPLRR
jgi:CMP-N,N'-diacetyllegionaminic acid synthase